MEILLIESYKLENADLEWLASGLPYSALYQDVYYSRTDERAESSHVFLEPQEFEQRWAKLDGQIQPFTVVELGFGSGLNFLQLSQLWLDSTERPANLHYIAFEKHPLSLPDLKRIHQGWPELATFSEELCAVYPQHSLGCHRLHLGNGICLDLYYGDALACLKRAAGHHTRFVDAWFMDGFSPKQNPEMWSAEIIQYLSEITSDNGTLSTYSEAGSVKRSLQAAGFQTEKIVGFGKKRGMLRAVKPASSPASSSEHKTLRKPENKAEKTLDSMREQKPKEESTNIKADQHPWFSSCYSYKSAPAKQTNAIVIGAGLAGCSTAYSLARRGWAVTVLESASEIASGASGNRQAALRCRLFRAPLPMAEFFLQGFNLAIRQLQQFNQQFEFPWQQSGVIQLDGAMKRGPNQGSLDSVPYMDIYDEDVLHPVSQQQASDLAGVQLSEGGIHFPVAGWLNPPQLCEQYLAQAGIKLSTASSAATLSYNETSELWTVLDSSGKALCEPAATLIIANSNEALKFQQTETLPIQSVRGQVSKCSSNPNSSAIKLPICGERTLFPIHEKTHAISASYSRDNLSIEPNGEDDSANLLTARELFQTDVLADSKITSSRVSFRCNSLDHIPIVGPVPVVTEMRAALLAVAKTPRNEVSLLESEQDRLFYPGLYANVAHGSNGLSSCPLSGEFLASLINGECSPLSRDMADALNPGRFVVRDLKKQSV